MVINRNFPRDYRHVFKIFQGVGLPEIMVEHTIDMVSYYRMHRKSDTLMGEAMRSSAEQGQI